MASLSEYLTKPRYLIPSQKLQARTGNLVSVCLYKVRGTNKEGSLSLKGP